MSFDSFVVFVHVAIAFLFVAGLVGRAIALGLASRSRDLVAMAALLEVAGRLERWFVIPGSILVLVAGLGAMWAREVELFGSGSRWLGVSLIVFLSTVPLVPFIFIPRGKRFEVTYQQAKQAGEVTPELTAAFKDRWVAAAHVYEGLAVACVLVLMVTKPF